MTGCRAIILLCKNADSEKSKDSRWTVWQKWAGPASNGSTIIIIKILIYSTTTTTKTTAAATTPTKTILSFSFPLDGDVALVCYASHVLVVVGSSSVRVVVVVVEYISILIIIIVDPFETRPAHFCQTVHPESLFFSESAFLHSKMMARHPGPLLFFIFLMPWRVESDFYPPKFNSRRGRWTTS